MLLELSDQSSETLQQQIVRQVRARILSDELSAGSELPSIRGLARELRVSVITVSRAYELLVRDELVHSRRGRGFYVSDVAAERKAHMSRQRLESQLEGLVGAALEEGLAPTAVRDILDSVLAARGAATDHGGAP